MDPSIHRYRGTHIPKTYKVPFQIKILRLVLYFKKCRGAGRKM